MKEMCKYYERYTEKDLSVTGRCYADCDDSALCFCGGDRCKCDFYSDIRSSAMLERSTELMNDISEILSRMDKTLDEMKGTLENFKEAYDNG